MKNSIKSLICALALGTTVAFAGPGGDAKQPATFATGIYSTADGNLNVSIEKKTPSVATILILNRNGQVLAREYIAKNQQKAAIKFNLSELAEGEYRLAVLSKGYQESKDFVISSEKAVTKRNLTFE
jgi:hypothetical protein